MSTPEPTVRVGPLALPRDAVLLGGALVAVELVALVAYIRLAGGAVLSPRYALYPFVWVNVAVLAVVRTAPVSGRTRTRLLAGGVAAAYVLVLGYLDGSITLAGSPTGFSVLWLSPGWGPAPVYDGAAVTVTLFPYRVVGYAALGYLLYATLVETTRAALGGLLGLASCVSCTLPVAAAFLSGLVGGAAGGVAAVSSTAWAYDLSTLVFVASVALLYWRPGFGTGGSGGR